MTYVSLFSGAGISDWGFHLAGWDCLAQVEIDKQANAVRKRHFPEVQHFTDVKEFDATQFRGVDAVIGGFPCQDYSVAGKRAGLDGDRGALWWQFHRVIRETRPRFVVGENVPGLLSSGKGLSFRTIVGSLVELGYCVSWRVLDLRYFRVPQRRRRVFIVASLGDASGLEILFEPESLCGDIAKGGEEGPGASGGVARCPRGRGNASHREDSDNYVVAQCHGGNVGEMGTLRRGNGHASGGVPFTIAHTLRAEGFDASEDGTGRGTPVVAFGWNKSPSQTMQVSDVTDALQASPSSNPAVAFTASSQANSYAWERPYYPTINAQLPNDTSNLQTGVRQGMGVRRLTPRECERLTGLDDDFTRWTFDGKEVADGPRYRMCGNAWAVPQAHYLAERMAAVLKRERLAA